VRKIFSKPLISFNIALAHFQLKTIFVEFDRSS